MYAALLLYINYGDIKQFISYKSDDWLLFDWVKYAHWRRFKIKFIAYILYTILWFKHKATNILEGSLYDLKWKSLHFQYPPECKFYKCYAHTGVEIYVLFRERSFTVLGLLKYWHVILYDSYYLFIFFKKKIRIFFNTNS